MTLAEPVPESAAVPVAWGRLRPLLRLAVGPAAVYLAASLFAKSSAFLLIPLYTRRLTPSQYGDLALAQTVISLLPSLLSLGLSTAVFGFYFEGDRGSYASGRVGGIARWLAAVTLGVAALLQCVLLLAPAGRVWCFGRWELTCMLWAAAGAALADVPALFLRAAQRPLAASAFQIGQFASIVVSGLVLVAWCDRGLRGAVEALALGYGLDGAVGLAFILAALRGPMTFAVLREGTRLSLPLIPHSLANQMQSVADRWTLMAAGSEAALGNYWLSCQLVQPAQIAVAAWNAADSPRMGESFRGGGPGSLRRYLARSQRTYLLVAGLSAVGTVALIPAISWVVGKSFAGAIFLTPVLGLSVVVESLYFPNCNALFYTRQLRAIPVITVSSAVINGALNLTLVGTFGISGAIAARLVSLGFRSLAAWWTARVRLDSSIPP